MASTMRTHCGKCIESCIEVSIVLLRLLSQQRGANAHGLPATASLYHGHHRCGSDLRQWRHDWHRYQSYTWQPGDLESEPEDLSAAEKHYVSSCTKPYMDNNSWLVDYTLPAVVDLATVAIWPIRRICYNASWTCIITTSISGPCAPFVPRRWPRKCYSLRGDGSWSVSLLVESTALAHICIRWTLMEPQRTFYLFPSVRDILVRWAYWRVAGN